ncbi:MAG: hypothetical protein ACJ8EL_01225 [Rhizomicrobium sp.]
MRGLSSNVAFDLEDGSSLRAQDLYAFGGEPRDLVHARAEVADSTSCVSVGLLSMNDAARLGERARRLGSLVRRSLAASPRSSLAAPIDSRRSSSRAAISAELLAG